MGIRVDEDALRRQLKEAGCEERAEMDFQKALLNGKLPYTVGGGIGQSRICMFYLRKATSEKSSPPSGRTMSSKKPHPAECTYCNT